MELKEKQENRGFDRMVQGKIAANVVTVSILAVILTVFVNIGMSKLGEARDVRFDVSGHRTASLEDATKQLLRRLDQPIEVYLVYGWDDRMREAAKPYAGARLPDQGILNEIYGRALSTMVMPIRQRLDEASRYTPAIRIFEADVRAENDRPEQWARDLGIDGGQRLAIVGESGSGKSTLLRALMGMVAPTSGRVTLDGVDIARTSRRELARHVQLVFQHARAALDPRRRVRDSIADTGRRGGSDIAKLLVEVGLDASHLGRYPHELSGGQAQRVGLARALNGDPELLLLDEPVSALDVSVRAQIIELLRNLHETRGLGWIVVTHDLAIVPHLATRVAVMLRGRIVEEGPVATVMQTPSHPYTRELLAAAPVPPALQEPASSAAE